VQLLDVCLPSMHKQQLTGQVLLQGQVAKTREQPGFTLACVMYVSVCDVRLSQHHKLLLTAISHGKFGGLSLLNGTACNSSRCQSGNTFHTSTPPNNKRHFLDETEWVASLTCSIALPSGARAASSSGSRSSAKSQQHTCRTQHSIGQQTVSSQLLHATELLRITFQC
jgi:hypothetical protein